MLLPPPAGAAAAATPQPKQRRLEEDQGGEERTRNIEQCRREMPKGQRRLITLMTKQLLRLSQQNREIMGCVFDTFLIPANSNIILRAQEQTSRYAEAVKVKGQADKLGPPHIWAMAGVLAALKEKGDTVGVKTAQDLMNSMNEMEAWTVDQKCELIMFCKIDKTYQKDTKRLTVCFRNIQFRQIILSALSQVPDTRRKHGKAPPTFMERELQAWVEGLLEEM
eukprot:7065430-Pyramimonas_sp.AAC.2